MSNKKRKSNFKKKSYWNLHIINLLKFFCLGICNDSEVLKCLINKPRQYRIRSTETRLIPQSISSSERHLFIPVLGLFSFPFLCQLKCQANYISRELVDGNVKAAIKLHQYFLKYTGLGASSIQTETKLQFTMKRDLRSHRNDATEGNRRHD